MVDIAIFMGSKKKGFKAFARSSKCLKTIAELPLYLMSVVTGYHGSKLL